MVLNSFKVSKNSIKGKGQDTVGLFEIYGTVSMGHVQFLKQYVGLHSVEYTGTISKDKKSIEGTWSMPAYNMSDSFKITVSHKIEVLLLLKEKLRGKLRQRHRLKFWVLTQT